MLFQSKISTLICFFFILFEGAFALVKPLVLMQIDSLLTQQDRTRIEAEKKSLILYEEALKENHSDSIYIFKKLAVLNAELDHPQQAFLFAEKYISNTTDFSILHNSAFNNISYSNEYELLHEKYFTKINVLSFIYFYVALIGFYFAIVINFSKKVEHGSKFLISLFVAVHSLFILEFVLYYSNLQYQIPHTYFMAAATALMYGPLLYLYFKVVTQDYKLKVKDALHFLPTVLVVIFLLPIYALSSSEKIEIMLGLNRNYEFFSYTVFTLKLTTLIVYGSLIGKLLYAKNLNSQQNNPLIMRWKKRVYIIHITYIFAYLVYGISISRLFGSFPSFVYHAQVIAICAMVIYFAYIAYVQPNVFSQKYDKLKVGLIFQKYEKSGLTESLAEELKENLIALFVEEKIYRENNLSLEMLAERLDTTRHNASQIINEHFNMNFFELINKFRIEEVTEIIRKDIYGNLQIIDIAYEVGYNNKVTFNKAFKKETMLTPTQYIETLRRNPIVNRR